MARFTLLFFLCVLSMQASAQTNFIITNPAAEQVLKGNYDPAQYAASVVVDDPAVIAAELSARISPDSLRSYIIQLSRFGNRNSGSDTLSDTRGIGAARRWVLSRFQAFSAENENRLLPGYFQFDRVICTVGQHRNIMAVLPAPTPTRTV